MYDEMIEQVTQAVFATLFEIELVKTEGADVDAQSLTASVTIRGEWSGDVLITMSDELARNVAGKMLKVETAEITTEDQNEVALEIANTIGGNLKSILPAPSQLSLPIIADESLVSAKLSTPGGESMCFCSEHGLARVAMFAQAS